MELTFVLAFDDSYFEHFFLLYNSLIERLAPPFRPIIHLVSDLSDPVYEQAIARHVTLSGGKIFIHSARQFPELNTFHLSRYLTKSTYSRIFMARVVPQHVKRALYIDCDTIFATCPVPLFLCPLGGKAVGAVEDFLYGARSPNGTSSGKFGKYFNAGVLVIDMEMWRSMEVERQLIDLLSYRRFEFHDQDALNIVFCENWFPLHPKWNVQYAYSWWADQWGKSKWERNRQILKAFCDPSVLHFTGPQKPWMRGGQRLGAHEYLRLTLAGTSEVRSRGHGGASSRTLGAVFWAFCAILRSEFGLSKLRELIVFSLLDRSVVSIFVKCHFLKTVARAGIQVLAMGVARSFARSSEVGLRPLAPAKVQVSSS